jgi:hypothetical protein
MGVSCTVAVKKSIPTVWVVYQCDLRIFEVTCIHLARSDGPLQGMCHRAWFVFRGSEFGERDPAEITILILIFMFLFLELFYFIRAFERRTSQQSSIKIIALLPLIKATAHTKSVQAAASPDHTQPGTIPEVTLK